MGRLSDDQLVDWLRLIRSDNVGPRTFRALLNRFGGAGAALEALPGLAAKSVRGREIRIATRDEVLREIEAAQAMGVRFAATGDPDYPTLLGEIPDAPPLLALRGAGAVARRDGVAIVGSRNASANGLAFTERLARGLAGAEFVVVSGLARGIDAVAHRVTLETGTIAVLAGGQARPYPAEHVRLVGEIAERGLVVSEMPLEWEPRGRDFPRRNRIISGIARATVVVEAARRSGSLITARFANEQGRDVFATPGSPLDPRAEGTNDLLRQGATLCTRAEDVIDALAAGGGKPRQISLFESGEAADEPLIDELDFGDMAFRESGDRKSVSSVGDDRASAPPDTAPPLAVDTRDPEAVVVALLGPSPIAVDDLIRLSQLPAREVQRVLMELDVARRIERQGTNLVALICN